MAKIAIGCRSEAADPDCLKTVFAELIFTFIFVFTGVGAAMASDKLMGGSGTIMGLTAVALAHGLVVAVLIAAGLHLSGAHLNPSVTLGLAVGGHITLVRSVLYIIAQLLASVLACVVLNYVTGGLETPVHTLGAGIGPLQGIVMEIILTFSLLLTVYGTLVDKKKIIPEGIGALFVGLIVVANILAGGCFSAASMNPARSFGPALVSWNWTDHWIYWVGPLIGGPLAGLLYENIFVGNIDHVPVPSEDTIF